MASLSPFFPVQFLTDAGAPAAGYTLTTYDSGTTTPKATYTDQGGLTANANPIVLDSAGRCSLWLGTGEYTFVLKDTLGATVETWNDVGGVPAAATASYVPLDGSVDMTGLLVLAGNATESLGATPLQQVNSLIAASTKAAANVSVADSGNYFTGTTGEAVLQELGAVKTAALSGNSGKLLTNDGTATSWVNAATGTIGSAGSVTINGGLIIKWGVTGTLALDSSGNTITFPTAFPTACYSVVCNPGTDAGVGAVLYSWGVHSLSAASFKINNDSSASVFYWIAIGS